MQPQRHYFCLLHFDLYHDFFYRAGACGGLAAGGVGILRRDDGKIARFQDDAAALGGFLIEHKVAVSIVSHAGLQRSRGA